MCTERESETETPQIGILHMLHWNYEQLFLPFFLLSFNIRFSMEEEEGTNNLLDKLLKTLVSAVL